MSNALVSKSLQEAMKAVERQAHCPDYEKHVFMMMADENIMAVQSVLDAENALKFCGEKYSQFLIDTCTHWLSERTFNKYATTNGPRTVQ